ncbi:F-box protein CPR1 [Medicago truncatula]|uniref:F-box protein CPR1 n=1 Tax=Medicago truncatula TaxID=3880 RepID=UPI000D2F38AC|nr:F-box protein CPR1 [Medicago truncatula]
MANPPTGKSNGTFVTNDIAFSVLSKLPLKSIKRFSSACKSWLYLRSGDNFQDEKELDMNLPSAFDARHFHILGSAIQGVLCLYIVGNQKNIILWNPDVSGQYRVLPTDYAEDLGSRDEDFVPNFQVHGFGYDAANHDFKVIQLVKYFGYHETISFWQVYCLRSNTWTKLNIPSGNQIPFHQYYPNGLEVYLDGFCHWLGRVAYGQLYLVSFNLTNYKFSVAAAPVDVGVTEQSLKLVVLNGSVAMINQHADPMSFSISILGKIGVKESWTKLFNVASLPSFKDPISAGKKGVIFFKGDENNGRVACFDLTTRMIEKEIDFGAKKNIQQIVFYKNRKNTGRH